MLADAGWADDMVKPEYPVAASRVLVSSTLSRDVGDGRIDYVLEPRPGVPVAAIEAKREYKKPAEGLQQAIRYAQQLRVPRAYATNGRGIVERDLTTGRERHVDAVPPPADLWAAYVAANGLDDGSAGLLAQPFNRNKRSAAGDVLTPRWYQTVAVQRVLAAMARGEDRVLLLMATGTGKTFTAMQIVHKLRLWHRETQPDRNYRVLYLADLDVLLTQPMDKFFVPAFGGDPLRRVKGGADLNRELYFASYQAMSGGGDEDELFRSYPADFFDLVLVDECHRGSAAANSSWRRVLDHFGSAVHLGLTATPKQDASIDTLSYFGEPVFTYSLREGIEDGYLAPYRVRRVVLSPDAEGWRPDEGQLDRFGRDIPDDLYTTREFERVVSLLARTDLAARHLSRILGGDPLARAMVFCVDQQHAEDMRAALVRHNPELVRADPEWVVRIVGSEPERVRLLEAFCDTESDSPVVATTSKLLSTGVDVEDLKYVVLFRPVGSMVEFKQIVGRGTRLFPEKGKTSFEIVDYVGATRHFADPAFDGYPTRALVEHVDDDGSVVGVDDGGSDETPATDRVAELVPGFEAERGDEPEDAASRRRPYVVDAGEFDVVAEAVLVADTSTGQLVLTEYGEHVAGRIRQLAGDAQQLLMLWSSGPDREEVRATLTDGGVDIEALTRDRPDLDPLDVLLQLAWNVEPRTRAERASRVRERHHAELEAQSAAARAALLGLLDRYAEHGLDDMTSGEVLALPPLADLGTPLEIARAFGGVSAFHSSLDELTRWLYETSA